MGTMASPYGDDEHAAVVLIDCAGGRELEVVRDTLAGSLNTPVLLIDRPALGSAALTLDLSTGLLNADGFLVRPAVAWIRHCAADAIMAQARPAGSVRPLGAASWSALLERIAASAAAPLPGSTPRWPRQLIDAWRLGVRVPRTVFTTDIKAAIGHLAARKAIVKTPDFRLFEPDRQAWPSCLPEIIHSGDVPESRIGAGPVAVQEYITHARELRVYYLNGGICAFDVRKPDPASMWVDPVSVTVTRVDCPRVAEIAVRTLSAAWQLRYAAFDLLVSPAGEVVFLEANPDGDWLWFERKAGWPGVSFMAAVMVRELFVRTTSVGVA